VGQLYLSFSDGGQHSSNASYEAEAPKFWPIPTCP